MKIKLKIGEKEIDAEIKDKDYQELDGEIKVGDEYWYVGNNGEIYIDDYTDYKLDKNRIKFGNAFRTKKQAEYHKLRLESLAVKQTAKKGEVFYYWDFEDKEAYEGYEWDTYLMERKFKTEAEAEEWSRKYDKAWRELG